MEALKRFEAHLADYGKSENGWGHLANQVLTYMFIGIVELGMFFPVFSVENWKNMTIVFGAFAAIAVWFFISPYTVQMEKEKQFSIYQKLAYVPISYKVIQKSLRKRLLRYIGITTGLAVIFQVGVTLLVCPQNAGRNSVYVVSVVGILPYVTGLIRIYRRK